MIGLLYLIAAVIYLIVLVSVVRWAWRIGEHTSKKRAVAFSGLAGFVTLLPLVYDYIPMLIIHQYYCDKDGGIVVYQDPARWMERHSSEIDGLRVRAGGEPIANSDRSWTGEYLVNRKVARRFRQTSFMAPAGVELVKSRYELFDVEGKAVLVARVSYSAGRSFQSGNLRFWSYESDCKDNSASQFHEFESLLTVFSESH
ncbi:hypothetical protein OPU71_06500 [Niveibacterium sp. 24ML]|uniref:hypothetical protein n=1 Tax=Niveibacterium sp. 24ML TaxID=2985512 RepID=UPI00227227E9|nr:hypothetical protein [Niveibacterium sp. 24ML]MCX9155775.1 hypothetical protein [Niveibacterium sp. 24ML]